MAIISFKDETEHIFRLVVAHPHSLGMAGVGLNICCYSGMLTGSPKDVVNIKIMIKSQWAPVNSLYSFVYLVARVSGVFPQTSFVFTRSLHSSLLEILCFSLDCVGHLLDRFQKTYISARQ